MAPLSVRVLRSRPVIPSTLTALIGRVVRWRIAIGAAAVRERCVPKGVHFAKAQGKVLLEHNVRTAAERDCKRMLRGAAVDLARHCHPTHCSAVPIGLCSSRRRAALRTFSRTSTGLYHRRRSATGYLGPCPSGSAAVCVFPKTSNLRANAVVATANTGTQIPDNRLLISRHVFRMFRWTIPRSNVASLDDCRRCVRLRSVFHSTARSSRLRRTNRSSLSGHRTAPDLTLRFSETLASSV
jgi:hypothetical protein